LVGFRKKSCLLLVILNTQGFVVSENLSRFGIKTIIPLCLLAIAAGIFNFVKLLYEENVTFPGSGVSV